MEARIIMRRTEAGLIPVDQDAVDALAKVAVGDQVFVKVHRPRSIAQHRAFWAMLTRVAEATDFETPERLLAALKLAMGRFDLLKLPNGRVVPVPQSISFAAMPQDDFQRFMDAAVRMIVRDVLPGTDPVTLIEGAQIETGWTPARKAA